VQLAQSLQKSPNYPVERTAGSHRVAAAAHRSVEFMHNDDKDHPTRWPAGELRKVNPSSIMRLSVSTVRQCQFTHTLEDDVGNSTGPRNGIEAVVVIDVASHACRVLIRSTT
jgi:hypothetical protein